MTSLENLFRTPGKKLIGYVPAGYPTFEGAKQIINAMIAGGVDAIEVGFPYSDPIMDGPIIQAAADEALKNGANSETVFQTLKHVSNISIPGLVMTYWNPIEKYGIENFAEAVSKNGGTGVITPDLTIEEAGEWLSACKKYALDPIFVVAPSTSDIRLKKVTAQCRGFIYAASLMGVTGTRSAISSQAEDLVARIRNVTSIPVSVGLGVSNAEQAKTVSKFADGVIVGSAFIAKVQSAKDFNEALHEVETLARELKAGIC